MPRPCFPRTNLVLFSDNAVANARWVGVQWGRGEVKPDRIFYGDFNNDYAKIDGGFYFSGDTSQLANILR
jgi:hypothetical protein